MGHWCHGNIISDCFKFCADGNIRCRHCKGVGVGFGASIHFNGLFVALCIGVSNLQATCLQSILFSRCNGQGNSIAFSSSLRIRGHCTVGHFCYSYFVSRSFLRVFVFFVPESYGCNRFSSILCNCSIYELRTCASLIGAGKDSHCGNGGLFSGIVSGAFLGFESLSFFAAVVGVIALAGVGGFSGLLLLKGRFKIHTVGRHGDLVCALLIKLCSNRAATGSLHAASFAQLIAIGSGKGSNNRSPHCGTNNAFSRVLNGNLNRTTFGRFHFSGNAILNDRKLWGDGYIVSRHCESIGVGFLAGLIRNNSILAVFNRQTVFSQLGQHRIVIHRLNSQSNSIASFHASDIVSRHLAVLAVFDRNAVGFNLNGLKLSANGNISGRHCKGVGVGFGAFCHRNGLFVALCIGVSNLQAIFLQGITVIRGNLNSNGLALSSGGRADFQLAVGG